MSDRYSHWTGAARVQSGWIVDDNPNHLTNHARPFRWTCTEAGCDHTDATPTEEGAHVRAFDHAWGHETRNRREHGLFSSNTRDLRTHGCEIVDTEHVLEALGRS